MTTIKMGENGSITLPAEVCAEFHSYRGMSLTVEAKDGQIIIRPSYEVEIWSPERTAYFLLINSMTKEEWDRNLPDVLEMGVDPTKIEGLDPNHRETLRTDAEWDAYMRSHLPANPIA